MNGLDFCDVLGGVADRYLQEAQDFRQENRRRAPRPRRALILIAACLCLLLLTLTVLAISGAGTRVVAFFTGRRLAADYSESGYDLQAAVEKFPVDALGEDVRRVGSQIARQYREFPLYSNQHPSHWQKSFASWAEACDFVGLDRLRRLDPEGSPQETTLNVYGDAEGNLQQLTLETAYEADGIRLQGSAWIYTEHYGEEVTVGTRTTEDIAFGESFYTNAGGRQCHIIESSALESGYAGLDGYLVDDGILYGLHIAYLEEDGQRARDLLYQWAELFA